MGRQTTNQTKFPKESVIEHDLDPDADGDLVRDINVGLAQAVAIALRSLDGNEASVSIDWLDSEERRNVYYEEPAPAVELANVTNQWARVVRKGPLAEVTVTSNAGTGTQNRVNVWMDTHR